MTAVSPRAAGARPAAPPGASAWRRFVGALEWVNTAAGYLAGLTIVATSLIIVFEVLVRYLLKWPTDWEIELSIFLLIIATFLGAAYTQQKRGHVTIEVLEHLLPPRVNHWRFVTGDVLSLVFCGFVAFNSWEFFWEAWSEGRVSNSAWGPPLWVPYVFMAIGMSMLALQQFTQIVDAIGNPKAVGVAEFDADNAAWSE